jgi:hypothetical protein
VGQVSIQEREALMLIYQAKRKRLRVPVSFPVRCWQADSEKLGGKAVNLSTRGIGLRTNSPIKIREEITVEFRLSETLSPPTLRGEVVWAKFHNDTAKAGDTLFSAGIAFLTVEKSFRGLILDYLLQFFWKEYLFGFREIQELLSDIKNLPFEEARIILHNYNFCLLFADRGCPSQEMMERAYLIPQFLSSNDLVKTHNTCWNCKVYKERQIYCNESAYVILDRN